MYLLFSVFPGWTIIVNCMIADSIHLHCENFNLSFEILSVTNPYPEVMDFPVLLDYLHVVNQCFFRSSHPIHLWSFQPFLPMTSSERDQSETFPPFLWQFWHAKYCDHPIEEVDVQIQLTDIIWWNFDGLQASGKLIIEQHKIKFRLCIQSNSRLSCEIELGKD